MSADRYLARLNLELATEPAIVALALEVRPDQVTFVPERREELTTEGGLDIVTHQDRITEAVGRCRAAGIEVALCAVFGEVLGLERVGVDDSFFDQPTRQSRRWRFRVLPPFNSANYMFNPAPLGHPCSFFLVGFSKVEIFDVRRVCLHPFARAH